MNQSSINTELQPPSNNNQEVLYKAIQTGKVSIMDFPNLSGFRTRVSNLRHNYGIKFKEHRQRSKNKFNRTISYVVHSLPEDEIPRAISIYNSITDNSTF